MRIQDKPPALCTKMTDEMNGDTSTASGRELDGPDRPQSNSSLSPGSSTADASETSGARVKCYKGTVTGNHNHKESDRDNGVGPDTSPGFSEDSHVGGGGRLKFFKDGKFILELSHRKDGEKTCWIPVPKKTFWPVVGTPRQESCASLSVSDDNSSIQSSPWQRDHCWKQTTPKKNLSKELKFFIFRPGRSIKFLDRLTIMRSRRRRPFIFSLDDLKTERVHFKIRKRSSLEAIVQCLWERVITTTCKTEPGIVSPRKRILRELERVSLEEATKRQRAKAPLRNVSSHSISSILAKEDESVLRTLLKSPSPPSTTQDLSTSASTRSHRFPPSSSSSSTSTFAGATTAAAGGAPPPPTAQSLSAIHPLTVVPPVTSSGFYQSATPPYAPHIWHYPVSSPPLPLPMFHVPSYSQAWPQIHRPNPSEAPSDVPLNLSKNAG